MIGVLRRFFAVLGLTTAIASAPGGSAVAAEPISAVVLGWVYGLVDASPAWTARLGGVSFDEEARTVTIDRLEIAAEGGGVSVIIEGATIAGYAEEPAGGFSAASLRIASATIKTADTDVVLTDLVFDDIGVPALSGVAYDRAKPFTSLIGAYSALAKSRAAGGRIGELAVLERMNGVTSRISYANVVVGRLADGKLEKISAGPLKEESPSPNPLVELTIAGAEASAIDLDAFLHVYDPLRYVAGIGDGVWRAAVGRTAYTDVVMTLPGIRLMLGSVGVDNFKVRQPSESFAPLIDAMMLEGKPSPAAMASLTSRYMSGLLSAYGVGRFAIERVDTEIAGIDQLSFDRLTISDASSDEIGEVAIEGLVGAVAGQGAVAIGRLALGGLVPPPADMLVGAYDGFEKGADVDMSALAPKLGYLEAAEINLQAIDFPGAALGQMRADFGNYVGSVPTNVAVAIDDLDIATSSLQPARARGLVAALGYDRIRADTSFSLNWREADGTVNLDDFRLDIENFGNTTASIVLAGLTREAIERSDGAAGLISDLLFDRASVTFEDKSVVERSLSMRADLLKIPLDRLRQQLAGALPLMLAFVGNPEKVKEIVPVLQSFIKTPGTLTIEAAPEPPVPVAAIEDAARSRPQSLPGMLGITITGTPGPGGEGGPAPAPEKSGALDEPPAIRKTFEPETRPGTTGSTSPTPVEPP